MNSLEVVDRAIEGSITVAVKGCSAIFHVHENTIRAVISILWAGPAIYNYPSSALFILPSMCIALLKTKMKIPAPQPPPEGMVDLRWEEFKDLMKITRIAAPIGCFVSRGLSEVGNNKDGIIESGKLFTDTVTGICLYFLLLNYLIPIYFDTGKKIREWTHEKLQKLKDSLKPEEETQPLPA